MARLTNVSTADLRAGVESYDQHRPIRRLLAAIVYKEGPSVPEIADWFDVREATVYAWFDRIEQEPLAEAVTDRQKPGRPPKLSEGDWERFIAAVDKPPSAAGYEGATWTPELTREHLSAELDTEYSRRHARRLLEAASDE